MTSAAYFVNGHVATIAAVATASSRNPNGVNVLLSERVTGRWPSDRYALAPAEYDEITLLLESSFPWTKVHRVDIPWSWFRLRRQPGLLGWLRFVALVNHVRPEVERALGSYRPFDSLVTSGNSQLWPLAMALRTKRVLIEHGAGDYDVAALRHRTAGPARWLKRLVSRVMSFPDRDLPDEAIFLDGGRSLAAARAAALPGPPLVVSTSPELVSHVFKRFVERYRANWPDEYAALMDIAMQLGTANHPYIYLPTDNVPTAAYVEYLRSQVDGLPLDDALVVIKAHPRDTASYGQAFRRLGIRSMELVRPLHRFLPAEFLAEMLGGVPLVGSYSSSLLYSAWWFDRRSILAVVPGHPGDQALTVLYQATLDDFAALGMPRPSVERRLQGSR